MNTKVCGIEVDQIFQFACSFWQTIQTWGESKKKITVPEQITVSLSHNSKFYDKNAVGRARRTFNGGQGRIYMIYLLTAIALTPGGSSTHLHTNNT